MFFSLRNHPQLRGHSYVLNKPRCNSLSGQRFFTNRVINLWNNLPGKTTDFTSLRKFCASINNNYLTRFCTVNYGWSYWVLLFIPFSVFLLFLILQICVMFYQLVRGWLALCCIINLIWFDLKTSDFIYILHWLSRNTVCDPANIPGDCCIRLKSLSIK